LIKIIFRKNTGQHPVSLHERCWPIVQQRIDWLLFVKEYF